MTMSVGRAWNSQVMAGMDFAVVFKLFTLQRELIPAIGGFVKRRAVGKMQNAKYLKPFTVRQRWKGSRRPLPGRGLKIELRRRRRPAYAVPACNIRLAF